MCSRILLASTFLCASAALAAQTPDPTQPPATQRPVLTLQGIGSQVYACRPTVTGFQWVFEAPAARLFAAPDQEVGTHGDGPTWTYQDSSSIGGLRVADTPAPEAAGIPWLLLKAVNPRRQGVLTTVEYIRRSETKGGLPPTTGCDTAHEGILTHVPYTATYTFYSSAAPAKAQPGS